MTALAPLIITLALDEGAFSFFNNLRKKYFPAERNHLEAHLTLFHALPAGEPSLLPTIAQTAAHQSRISLSVTGPAFLGNGVAYKLESQALMQLHHSLQSAWKQWLTPQDQQRLWPHVTVQNKVPAVQARVLLEELTQAFSPFTAYGTGLQVWVYRGGPWEALTTYPFTKEAV